MCIVIWKRRDSSLYYRVVRGTYKNYFIGYENQYHHKVVFIINNVYISNKDYSFKAKCKNRIIRYLQRNL